METLGNGGRIVNMSSIAGFAGISAGPSCAHYGATKHALHGMTQTMALEYIHAKIRLSQIQRINQSLNKTFQGECGLSYSD